MSKNTLPPVNQSSKQRENSPKEGTRSGSKRNSSKISSQMNSTWTAGFGDLPDPNNPISPRYNVRAFVRRDADASVPRLPSKSRALDNLSTMNLTGMTAISKDNLSTTTGGNFSKTGFSQGFSSTGMSNAFNSTGFSMANSASGVSLVEGVSEPTHKMNELFRRSYQDHLGSDNEKSGGGGGMSTWALLRRRKREIALYMGPEKRAQLVRDFDNVLYPFN